MAVILKSLQTGVRVIQLLASLLILGIFSWFLSLMSNHHIHIPAWVRAVEGMSGAAALYGCFAVLLTCCLGGKPFFAFIAMALDACFVGCFVAIAILNRHGANSCNGYVRTPIGDGNAQTGASGYGNNGFGTSGGSTITYLPKLHLACRFQTVVFAVAIINAFLFIVTLGMQLALGKQHQKEKRFGPSPANDYTSGSGRRPFWKRGNRKSHVARDAELGAVGVGAVAAEKHHHHNNNLTHNAHASTMRPSHDTAFTESTAVGNEPVIDKYGTGTGIASTRHSAVGAPTALDTTGNTTYGSGVGHHSHGLHHHAGGVGTVDNTYGSGLGQGHTTGIVPTTGTQTHGYGHHHTTANTAANY